MPRRPKLPRGRLKGDAGDFIVSDRLISLLLTQLAENAELRPVFDDLLDLEDKAIQLVLREVQGDALVVALKGASPELREKILKNMSSRAAETLRDDLESKGPVRLSEVEGQQKEILKIVRRLADEGLRTFKPLGSRKALSQFARRIRGPRRFSAGDFLL